MKSIAFKLATMDDLTSTLILREFGWSNYWYLEGSFDAKVRSIIDHIQEFGFDHLNDLGNQLTSFDELAPQEMAESVTNSRKVLVFISHMKEYRQFASELKSGLAKFCIDSFVAHDDIGDNELWRTTLRKELSGCDAFVSLVTDGYEASVWCQQEIGWVTSIDKLTMGVKFKEPVPALGFLGEQQLINFRDFEDLSRRIRDVVSRDHRTSVKWRESVLSELEVAYSWDRVRSLWKLISQFEELSSNETKILRNALETNEQVRTTSIDYGPDGEAIKDFIEKYGTN